MLVQADDLVRYSREIFERAGVPAEEAEAVSEELVMSNLMGIDSHGVLRIPQYLWQMDEKFICPGANVRVIRETPVTAVVDADHGFGHIAARKMADVLIEKAGRTGVACAIAVNCTHIGRLGAYTEKIARAGFIAFGTVALYSCGPMAPFGSKTPKLGTNPISWAVPRKDHDPVMMDGATTVCAEGKLRTYIQKGMPVPEGWIRDGYGRDTTDPNDFYKEPHGTILPLGGKSGGAKGSALAMMADLFTIALANEDYWSCLKEGKKPSSENGVFMMAVDPDSFFGREEYFAQVDNHARFMKDAEPAEGFKEVLLPGELEFRTAERRRKEGIELPEATWNGILGIAQKMGCKWASGFAKVKQDSEFVQDRKSVV